MVHFLQVEVVLHLVHAAVHFFNLLHSFLGQLGLLICVVLEQLKSVLGLLLNALQLPVDLLLLHPFLNGVLALLALRQRVVLQVSVELQLLVLEEIFTFLVLHLLVFLSDLPVLISQVLFVELSLLLNLLLDAFSPLLVVSDFLFFLLHLQSVCFFQFLVQLLHLFVRQVELLLLASC